MDGSTRPLNNWRDNESWRGLMKRWNAMINDSGLCKDYILHDKRNFRRDCEHAIELYEKYEQLNALNREKGDCFENNKKTIAYHIGNEEISAQ